MFGSKRSVRVGENIMREVALLLLEKVNDPRVRDVTVTDVQLSDDLKQAKVFYSVLGDKDMAHKAQTGLDSAKGFIKHQIGQRLELRYMPEIRFVYDPSLEFGSKMNKLFEKIHTEEEKD